jgi:hypothetical protein
LKEFAKQVVEVMPADDDAANMTGGTAAGANYHTNGVQGAPAFEKAE